MPLLRTSLLGAEPAGTLHSLDELFALASAMEQEAATRYGELAEEMRVQNKSDLSALFTQLAAAEREHVDSVTRWSQSCLGRAPNPALVRWEAPETLRAEATEIMTSRLMTPYRALSMAVRNEERASHSGLTWQLLQRIQRSKMQPKPWLVRNLGMFRPCEGSADAPITASAMRHGPIGRVALQPAKSPATLQATLMPVRWNVVWRCIWPAWRIILPGRLPIARASFRRKQTTWPSKPLAWVDFPPALNTLMRKRSLRR